MEALFWPDLIIVGGGVSEKADKFVPKELVARYEVEGAAPVEVDREEVARLGVRLREAALLAEDAEAGLRHDPDRLARQACEAALVRLLQSPAN
jgi:predicted NBD/HSP70 family sugar kinase